ncbi:hypothetical protein KIF59_21255 [Enterobacter cloacae subsp. cloacae]|nr:hypothetical protein [Enterobacter cloacae subsp. cloacae]
MERIKHHPCCNTQGRFSPSLEHDLQTGEIAAQGEFGCRGRLNEPDVAASKLIVVSQDVGNISAAWCKYRGIARVALTLTRLPVVGPASEAPPGSEH